MLFLLRSTSSKPLKAKSHPLSHIVALLLFVTIFLVPSSLKAGAVNDYFSTPYGTPLSGNVLSNDTGVNKTVTAFWGLTCGSLTLMANGDFTYSPGTCTGTVTFTYRMSYGFKSDTALVTIEITGSASNPPVANDDTAATAENTPVTINVLSNDNDPDGDDLSITQVSDPANGTATIDGDLIQYTPNNGFNGTDSFTYTISDGTSTATATVAVNVTPVNTAPIPLPDTAVTQEETPVTIDVLANDSDPDEDTLSLTGVSTPLHGTTSINNGKIVYTPNANFIGIDNFIYTVTDGTFTVTTNVTVTVTGPDNLPDMTCSFPRNFSKVFSMNLRGDIEIIGNTVLCQNDPNNPGQCSDPGDKVNNDIDMIYINSSNDGGISTPDPSIFNYSTATLSLPEGSRVVWAGLYWQSMLNGSDVNEWNLTRARTVRFKKPGGEYVEILSEPTKFNWIYATIEDVSGKTTRLYYQGMADITDIIDLNNPDGNYSVANIIASEGQPVGGSYGAWSIVLVYADDDASVKNVSVFDGYLGILPHDPDVRDQCPDKTGGNSNPLEVEISGFLTPKSGSVTSSLAIFAGEGDRGYTGDTLSVTNREGTSIKVSNALNPSDNTFNASVTKKGTQITTLYPQATLNGGDPWPNTLGIDIDFFDVSTILENNQTSTLITMETVGDGYFPGVFAFSTELYVPRFCYDYAYKQNNRYLKKDYTTGPTLLGPVIPSNPIDLRLYFRNMEASDILAKDVTVNIIDLNTTQISYEAGTTRVVPPGSTIQTPVPDSPETNESQIVDIPIGVVDSHQYFYTYMDLDPKRTDLNTTLKGYLSMILDLGDGLEVPTMVNISDMDVCQPDYVYQPAWGIFNVVQNDLYDPSTGLHYYNIPTQVARRVGNYTIVSHDPLDYNAERGVSTIVSVELIDAGGYNDINATCDDPASAITPRIWMIFDGNVSEVVLNHDTLQQAIQEGRVWQNGQVLTNITPEEIFGHARENAAFRISYVSPGDGNFTVIEKNNNGEFYMATWNVQWQGDTCVIDMDGDGNAPENDLDDKVANFCQFGDPGVGTGGNTNPVASNASSNGYNGGSLAACMECLFGRNVNYYCSRDNFALRPESFNVRTYDGTKDGNLTFEDPTHQLSNYLFDANRTGVPSPDPSTVAMAAGYRYIYDINATSYTPYTTPTGSYHSANEMTEGYTRYFNNEDPEANATFLWVGIQDGCNDTSDKNVSLLFIDGMVRTLDKTQTPPALLRGARLKVSQTGQYLLHLVDKSWTAADWDPSRLTHHNSPYFLSGADCTLDSGDVVDRDAPSYLNGTKNFNGCEIRSEHNNTTPNGANLQYRDLNVTFYPYRFDLSGLAISPTPRSGENAWVYTYTMPADPTDEPMALKIAGPVKAVGADNLILSNYVDGCMAQNLDLNLSMTSDRNLTDQIRLQGQYQFRDARLFFKLGEEDPAPAENNATVSGTSILSGYHFSASAFKPDTNTSDGDSNGTAELVLYYNFEHHYDDPSNPLTMTINDLNLSDPRHTLRADQVPTMIPEGNFTPGIAERNITFFYARVKPTRYLYDNITAHNVNTPIIFQRFCNLMDRCADYDINLSDEKTAEYDWYLNKEHNSTQGDGSIVLTAESSDGNDAPSINGSDPLSIGVVGTSVADNVTVSDGGITTRPLSVQVDFVTGLPGTATDQWLIFNPSKDEIPTPFYRVNFIGNSDWVGYGETGNVVESNSSRIRTNRVEW